MASHYIPRTKVPTLVFSNSNQAARHIALQIEEIIKQNLVQGKFTVLGLPTGSTPVGLYRELIRMHKMEGLDFSKVITFNLDEYYPLDSTHPQSYRRWMRETFFDHVNIPDNQINIPDGTLAFDQIEEFCINYEKKIRQAGGLDLQLLGIGRTGHMGFNEPGSTRHSRTRLATLDAVTRRDAAQAFFGEENVPLRALTMGIGTIMDARKVILMAYGEHKAPIVAKALEGPVSENVTASFLQEHQDATYILDQAASKSLSAIDRPWAVGPVSWNDTLIRKAVIELSLKTGKGLLKLSDDDFREHELYELLREHGPASVLGLKVFKQLMDTICNEPAGNLKKTILVFSPHPDDDVISMGGTLIRLVEQGHKVFVAYMTSGNIAVFDHDAWRFTDYAGAFNSLFKIDEKQTHQVKERVRTFLDKKSPGQSDSDDLLKIKSLIRETEARAAALACGIPPEQLEFMNLRFYRTGTIAKAPIHSEDIDDIQNLIKKLNPFQIYVAGELSDPHGTHRVCAEAIFEAVRRARTKGDTSEIWLYRGAWEEWEPQDLERVVPLGPEELERKKMAIFRHQSQKDRAMFPGNSDRREFWQRAEDRNLGTARIFDHLGLSEFFALEGFVQWKE
ncbi:MAG: glucosamine-6-phosphate deaminase [Planctomycetota bacterium]|nr:MAG: glucosamine-6-phosphate deaminase [Planctomycetota bacterium]